MGSNLALTALLDLGICRNYGAGYLLACLFGGRGVYIRSAVDYSDDLCLGGWADQLKARLFDFLLLFHAQNGCLFPFVVLGLYLRLGEHEAIVGLDDIRCGLIEIAAYVSAVPELILFHVAHVSSVLRFWSFLLLFVASEDTHCLHVHTTDSSQEGLLEILLDQMLASFIFLILLCRLC